MCGISSYLNHNKDKSRSKTNFKHVWATFYNLKKSNEEIELNGLRFVYSKNHTTAPMHKTAWYFPEFPRFCATTPISKLPGTHITWIKRVSLALWKLRSFYSDLTYHLQSKRLLLRCLLLWLNTSWKSQSLLPKAT